MIICNLPCDLIIHRISLAYIYVLVVQSSVCVVFFPGRESCTCKPNHFFPEVLFFNNSPVHPFLHRIIFNFDSLASERLCNALPDFFVSNDSPGPDKGPSHSSKTNTIKVFVCMLYEEYHNYGLCKYKTIIM